MSKNYYQGTMITVELPKNQYKGYVVDCVYRYVKNMNKYALSIVAQLSRQKSEIFIMN